jgi:hypothetical protein
MTAAHWRKHSLYLLAVATSGSDANNLVVVWDYKNDTFWLWDNIEVQFWLSDEDAADNEKLYFGDSVGRIYEFGVGKTDHGAAIEAYLVTDELARTLDTKRFRSVEVTSTNKSRGLTVELLTNDEVEGTEGTLTLTDSTNEEEYGIAVYDTSSYTPKRRRTKRLMFNEAGEWAAVKVSHSEKNVPMQINDITLGVQHLGRRR